MGEVAQQLRAVIAMDAREYEDIKVPQHLATVLPQLMLALLFLRVQIYLRGHTHTEEMTPVPSLGM